MGLGGAAAAAGGLGATPASAEAQAAVPGDRRPYGTVGPPDPDVPGSAQHREDARRLLHAGPLRGQDGDRHRLRPRHGRGAACLRLAREGANVVGVDWLEDQGREDDGEIAAEGHATRFVAGDVGDRRDLRRMVEVAVEAFGGIDAALNNAGVMDGVFPGEPVDYAAQKDLVFAPIHEATEAYWDNVFRTNVKGVFLSMRHELRQMLAQGRGGSIVNVGSIAGLTGLAGNPAYWPPSTPSTA
jgi:hypothetical protein